MLPEDFKELLPKRAHQEPDDRPVEVLWIYDPQEAKVHIEDGHSDHPAHFPTHKTFATHVTHPDRKHGYAYAIKGGWRITDADHHAVDDPFIAQRIRAALRREHPPALLPSIRYHGDPRS